MSWRALLMIGLVCLLGAVASPSVCFAQMSPEKQFLEGQKLYDAGDFEHALPFFRNAFERSGSPNARLYVARCLVRLEQFVRAYNEMYGTLELASEKAQNDSKYNHTRDAASAELKLIEPKIGKLVLTFSEEYPEAELYLASKAVAPDQQGLPIVVLPGSLQVEAYAPGKARFRQHVEVNAGQTVPLVIVLEEETTQGPEPPEPEFELGTTRTIGIAVASIGVVGIVVFAIFGSMAKSKFTQLEDECGEGPCTDPSYGDIIDDGKTYSTVANVSAIVGGAMVVGGGLMIAFGGPGEDDGATAASLEPLPGGAILRFGGAF